MEVLESKNDDMIVQEFIFNARKAAKHRVEQRQQNLGEALGKLLFWYGTGESFILAKLFLGFCAANGGAKEEAKAEGCKY